MDMIFSRKNLSSLYRSASVTTVSRQLATYKLDLVGVQQVRWDKGGTVGHRTSYIVLRGRWCDSAFMNAHTPIEEKSDDSKESVCEELEQVFDQFPKYHMKIL
jgi:hypothetical protein